MQKETYYSRHKEERKEKSKMYYLKNKETINAEKKKKRRLNPNFREQIKTGIRIENASKLKDDVLKHYGKECACCGETCQKLLTVDHIEDNGKEHGNGKRRYKGTVLYAMLISLNYPKGIQVLCFNCNIGRRNNGGICPHKTG